MKLFFKKNEVWKLKQIGLQIYVRGVWVTVPKRNDKALYSINYTILAKNRRGRWVNTLQQLLAHGIPLPVCKGEAEGKATPKILSFLILTIACFWG